MPDMMILEENIFRPVNLSVKNWLTEKFKDSTSGLYGNLIHHLVWASPDRAFSWQGMHDSAGQADLPIMSFYLESVEEIIERRCIPSLLTKYNNPVYDVDFDGTSLVKLFVKPYRFIYNIAFWTDQREELERIITAFKYEFAPHITIAPSFHSGKVNGFIGVMFIESSNELSEIEAGTEVTTDRYQINLICEIPLPLMASQMQEIRSVTKNYYTYNSDSTNLVETTYTP